ncbi:MAG: pilin [Candidatus Peribacteria bacterium]|nr:pilin [Candidatus Peribacteria bacterium]
MKKTMYGFLLGLVALLGIGSIVPVLAQTNSWDDAVAIGQAGDLSQGKGINENQTQTGDKLINSIKSFINWVLGMLATIALVICLYAGFLMVTSAGDEAKYKKGMDILKKAGIGLIIIGLAWLIVSVVFWLIGNMTK